MGKIEQIHPVPQSIVSSRVVISNKIFTQIVNHINLLVDTTNTLINRVEQVAGTNENLHQDLEETKQSLQNLAKAVQTLQNL